MKHAEQVRLIEGLMAHLDNGTNVDAGVQLKNPVSCYLSEDLAGREWETFFQRYPQVMGLSGDLSEPESFFTSNELGKPILCTRGRDGIFRAFLNVCRHRATVVEEEPRGCKKRFTCPFHAWAYDHEGKLVGIPKEEHFGRVDRKERSLVELPAVERYGLLFVSPDPTASFDVDSLLGDLGPELENWKLDQFARNNGVRYDHPMNWKLAIDTFGETYHFNSLHRNSLAEGFYGNVQMYDRYERNHRMMLCMRSIDDLRTKPQNRWNILEAALPVYYLFPNIQLLIGGDGPILVRVYPCGANPEQSFSEISFYTESSEPNAERLALNAMRMHSFAAVIQNEDYVAAESGHRGAKSGAQEYIVFGRNEPALHHYHNTYRQALGMSKLEALETS